MDSPTPAELPSASQARPKRRARWFVVIGAFVLLVIFTSLLVFTPPDPQFVWLTPEEISRASKPSSFARVTETLKRVGAPFVRWYQAGRPDIKIYGAIFPTSPAAAEQFGLGQPVTTTTNGMRAWILPAAEYAAFKQGTNFPILNPLTITAHNGLESHMAIGVALSLTPTNILSGALNMKVLPRKSAGAVQLRAEPNLTEMTVEIAFTNNRTVFRTNNFGFRATIPDNGGLVIQTGNWGGPGQTNQWFLLLSPQPVSPQKR